MFRQCILLFVLCAATATAAARPSPVAAPMVDLAVIDSHDERHLPEYRHRGEAWIAGIPGHRYVVQLRNRSDQRVLVLLSVDGVNAVSGETADPSQAGYVLGPWQTAKIAGWRKSLDDVARFVFTALPDSYAARTGRPDNVGVIGIAVFREARPVHRYRPHPPIARSAADARATRGVDAPAMRSSVPRTVGAESAGAIAADAGALVARERIARQQIGTGHGARAWAPVSRTSFVRASYAPAQISELRYDDIGRLLAMGVIPRSPYRRYDAPSAFPRGFVADPPRR